MLVSQPSASRPAETMASFALRIPAWISACGNRAFEYDSALSNHFQSFEQLAR